MPIAPGRMCAVCLDQITPETCAVDPEGVKWDLCKTCWERENPYLDPAYKEALSRAYEQIIKEELS